MCWWISSTAHVSPCFLLHDDIFVMDLSRTEGLEVTVEVEGEERPVSTLAGLLVLELCLGRLAGPTISRLLLDVVLVNGFFQVALIKVE